MNISYKNLFKSNRSIKTRSKNKIFDEEEENVFKELFNELKEPNENYIKIDKLVNYYNLVDEESYIHGKIIENLKKNKEKLDFDEFINALQNLIGNFKNENGLKIIYNYFVENSDNNEVANINGIKKLVKDLNINLKQNDIQELINYYSKSYNKKDNFSFEDFKSNFLKY